jgi:peptidoglycan hydrolase-like protein with peptidoglycan-binding domain
MPSQAQQKPGQQIQQGTQGRSSSQQTEQRQLQPQQGQAGSSSITQQQGAQGSRAGSSASAQQTGQAGNATVTLNEQQRTRVRETVFARSDAPRVDHVNFSLAVGTVVPESVHVVAVPETLVEIRPEWRDDMYFLTGDDIVIIDHSHRIVEIVAAGPTTGQADTRERTVTRELSTTRGTSASMSVEEIRQVQIALNAKGFDVGTPDGRLGARTRQALIAFQKQQGFQGSGQLDQQTVAALGISGNMGASGNMGSTTGTGSSSSSSGQGGTSSSAAQPGGSSLPSSRSGQTTQGGSSTEQGSQTGMPSSSTSGQGGSGKMNQGGSGKMNQGGSGSMNQRPGTSGSSTTLPSGQSR